MTAAEIVSAIVALCNALPELVQFGAWIEKIAGDDPAAFVAQLGSAFDQLNSAQTEQEKQNAAQNLANLIHKLPS